MFENLTLNITSLALMSKEITKKCFANVYVSCNSGQETHEQNEVFFRGARLGCVYKTRIVVVSWKQAYNIC